jgi:Mg2+ and Co2+ transporter CorA
MRMDVHFVGDGTIMHHPVGDLQDLLDRDDGLVWVDIAACDDAAAQMLSDVFDVHPRVLRACVERNRVPKVHAYAEHVFVIGHEPERGAAGHVHYIEMDQIIGHGYLVTVHGPVNPAVDPDLPLRHTRAVLRRIEAGRLRPRTAFELSYAIMSGVTRHMEEFIEDLTNEVWQLEQQVTAGHLGDPEQFLEDLFRARHGLLAVRTMAVASREIYGRMTALQRFVPSDDRALVEDLVDQFSRIDHLADGEKDYLQGVIEFYRARTETKMTIAAERLAVIAVVTLPITALASVYGMNVIVNDRTDFVHLAIVLTVMAAMSGLLLRWAKRHGWW